MSKVLVDRELLERIASDDEGVASSADFEDLKRVLAQPAEAEGELPEPYGWIAVGELYMIRENAIRAAGKTSCIGVYTRPQLLAALSAVTAERDRLREEMAELWKRIDKFQSQSHGITALAEIERLRAESEELRADAERFRWLAHQGDACQWMNIIRVDPDDFESYAEAIDAAMAAKEA